MPPLLISDPILDAPLTGAPYLRNDLVVIEVQPGQFCEVRVHDVTDRGPQRFGLRWTLRVGYEDAPAFTVYVNDNGENHARGHRVFPSTTIED